MSGPPPGVERDFPLARLTTVRTGGAAEWFARPEDEGALLRVLAWAGEEGVSIGVVGSGSNLLVADAGFRGLALKLDGDLAAIQRDGERLLCGGGVRLPSAAARGRRLGPLGLEFGINIPGTVGGAVQMNANAYGGQLARCSSGSTVCTAAAASDAADSSASPTAARTWRRRGGRPAPPSARAAEPRAIKATMAGMRESAARRSPPGSRPSARPSRTPRTSERKDAPPGSCWRRRAAAACGRRRPLLAEARQLRREHGEATTADVLELMAAGAAGSTSASASSWSRRSSCWARCAGRRAGQL
jgi:hypothetical protein